jgi:hypothetical protein
VSRTVIGVLRRFLPDYLRTGPPALTPDRRRAIWALTQCRTPALGGHLYACGDCGKREFAYHSCNHRACPQCGRAATAKWVARELGKRIDAPYFMVTFTLPSELRELFFGPLAKDAFDAFFAASSRALAEKLAAPKAIGAAVSGFTGVLHTCNQRLGFHPHIHYLVPGAGLDEDGRFAQVKNANFLAPLAPLRRAFRWHFRQQLEARDWQVDPAVWTKDWGVHIQPFGSGENAIKYLGAYVCRTAIGDSRIVSAGEHSVTFTWKDRAQSGRTKTETLSGVEFTKRYLRHVLPRGLRSIRYFGFCHPAAKGKRLRVAFHSGRPLEIGALADQPELPPREMNGIPRCPCCQRPMKRIKSFRPLYARGPPPS